MLAGAVVAPSGINCHEHDFSCNFLPSSVDVRLTQDVPGHELMRDFQHVSEDESSYYAEDDDSGVLR